MIDKKRYLDKGINKIGFVDIETHGFGFNANQSYLISWVIHIWDLKRNKSKIVYDYLDKKTIKYWMKKIKKDKKLQTIMPIDTELLKGLVFEMKKCNMIIGHYSDYFDVPLIRTRCFMLKIPFIKYTDKTRFGDTWKHARYGMSFIRNTLDNMGISFNLQVRKTHYNVWVWVLAARYGDRKSMKKVIEHNKKDVEITRKVWQRTEYCFGIPAKYK